MLLAGSFVFFSIFDRFHRRTVRIESHTCVVYGMAIGKFQKNLNYFGIWKKVVLMQFCSANNAQCYSIFYFSIILLLLSLVSYKIMNFTIHNYELSRDRDLTELRKLLNCVLSFAVLCQSLSPNCALSLLTASFHEFLGLPRFLLPSLNSPTNTLFNG
jgi:hypothetical protein